VLDVCCGVGELAQVVSSRYVGVDANPRFIEQARRRYAGRDRTRFEVGDVLRLEYPAGHFDRAMVVNILHHFSDEEAARLLAQVRRITRRLVIVIDADGTPPGGGPAPPSAGAGPRALHAHTRPPGGRGRQRAAGGRDGGLPGRLYDEVLLRCPLDAG
jgi:ubiquinone/menaquinone biosynthesis C-methylase UbiE